MSPKTMPRAPMISAGEDPCRPPVPMPPGVPRVQAAHACRAALSQRDHMLGGYAMCRLGLDHPRRVDADTLPEVRSVNDDAGDGSAGAGGGPWQRSVECGRCTSLWSRSPRVTRST